MPLPRYVLHWLRVDRHGLAYSDMSDEDTVISSPTTPGHCRIAKDVYMYLMTQGYCRYVKPEANRFDVGEDDLYSFVYQISELADARSDKETKMYLHEIWDLVTSCHPPLMLLPERIAEAPDDIVRNIFHLWYECQVQRYETFRVVIEAGFDFVAYNRGWQQGRDAWNRFFLRELDELGNDPDDEDFLRLREDYIPFARLLVNLGCHIHRWVVIRMISMLVTSGRDSRNSILYAIEVGRRSQSLEFQEPGEAAYMFLQCISDFSVSTTANLRILIECHVPLADVAIKTIDRLFRHGRIPDFNLMYRLSKAAELLKPNVNRTWQQAAQHVYQNRDPEVVAAEQRAVQAGGDDQARLNAGFMAAKALASQRMDLIFHQAMQVHIARVDPALPMLQTSITRSHVCAPDVVSYITRWTKTNPQYYMPILQHFVADPVIHGPFMNAVKKNYIWEVERQHRQQLQQSGLQNAPQLELKVEDVSDEVAIDYLNQKIRLG